MKTTDIFQTPSFLKGIARSVDLFASLDAYAYDGKSDAELIARDWMNVGEEFHSKIRLYAQKSTHKSR